MDENFTFREQYPADYEILIKSPLNKTIFKYKKDDGVFVDHFTADATKGMLSIVVFPETPKQITNVIDKILSGN